MALSKRPGDEPDNPAIWNADTTLRKEDYFNEFLDGTQSPNDIGHEPDLYHLLKKLYERQRAEAFHMLDEVMDQFDPEGEPIEKLKVHKEEFLDSFHEECSLFAKERDRYIEEFQAARRLREEMEAEEKRESLEHQKEWEKGHGHSH